MISSDKDMQDKKSFRDAPILTAVAVGDSITAGGSATDETLCWVSLVAGLIGKYQGNEVKILNHGIGANILSVRSPAYEFSQKPSLLERYEKHVIEHRPDLALIAIGTNDIRGGTPPDIFAEDLKNMVSDIGEKVDGCLKVLLGPYLMTCYSHDEKWRPWNCGDMNRVYGFNEIIKKVARDTGSLFVDVLDPMDFTPWMTDPDLHPTNLGHAVIAFSIFNVMAANCRCLAEDPHALARDYAIWRRDEKLVEEWNTGAKL
jgi:lysophospholipase L1-like esterase